MMPRDLQPSKPPQRSCIADRRRQVLAHLPVDLELSGSAAFRHTRHMLVPKHAGVYLVHDLRGVLYVGRTRNLYRRFHEHYWLTDNELLVIAMRQPFGEMTFSWMLVEDIRQGADLECRLIAWLQPPCNRLIPNNVYDEGE